MNSRRDIEEIYTAREDADADEFLRRFVERVGGLAAARAT